MVALAAFISSCCRRYKIGSNIGSIDEGHHPEWPLIESDRDARSGKLLGFVSRQTTALFRAELGLPQLRQRQLALVNPGLRAI